VTLEWKAEELNRQGRQERQGKTEEKSFETADERGWTRIGGRSLGATGILPVLSRVLARYFSLAECQWHPGDRIISALGVVKIMALIWRGVASQRGAVWAVTRFAVDA
jgi:hypothetical protein